jgi:hypothetical protein
MMLLVNEEFGVVPPNLGGDQNDRVHADLAFGETPSGGALFATSSIAWCGSLSYNNYDNNVARITWNVLKRFSNPHRSQLDSDRGRRRVALPGMRLDGARYQRDNALRRGPGQVMRPANARQ